MRHGHCLSSDVKVGGDDNLVRFSGVALFYDGMQTCETPLSTEYFAEFIKNGHNFFPYTVDPHYLNFGYLE